MGFWDEHCPSRPADLLHAHDRDCEDGHLNDQCCECGMRAMASPQATEIVTTTSDGANTPAPLDVPARLEALGMMPIATAPPSFATDEQVEELLIGDELPPRKAMARANRLRFLRWLYRNRPDEVE